MTSATTPLPLLHWRLNVDGLVADRSFVPEGARAGIPVFRWKPIMRTTLNLATELLERLEEQHAGLVGKSAVTSPIKTKDGTHYYVLTHSMGEKLKAAGRVNTEGKPRIEILGCKSKGWATDASKAAVVLVQALVEQEREVQEAWVRKILG